MLSHLVLWVTVTTFLVANSEGHERNEAGCLPVGSACSSDAECTTGVCDTQYTGRCVCPDQFQQCGRLCYAYFSQIMSQADAQAHCRSLGAQLPVPRTQSENDCVLQNIGRLPIIWLGINDRDEEFVFLAEDGLGPLYYTNWETEEPNHVNGTERCVDMYTLIQGRWNDIPCDNHNAHFAHICQLG